MAGVQKDQWSAYVREIFRITKPGTGCVQIIEGSVYHECDDDSVPKDAAVWEYQRYQREYLELRNNLILTPDHVEPRVRAAGFVDIQVRHTRLHIGDWGLTDPMQKAAAPASVRAWIGSIAPMMDGFKQWVYPDDNERAEFVKRLQADFTNKSYHLYCRVICITGRRPEA